MGATRAIARSLGIEPKLVGHAIDRLVREGLLASGDARLRPAARLLRADRATSVLDKLPSQPCFFNEVYAKKLPRGA